MKNREYKLEYKNEVISYKLSKSKIKNIYIYIKNGEVIVKAPTRIKEKYIHEFVRQKASWIYKKIKEEQKRPQVQEVIKQEDIEKLELIVKNSIEKYTKLIKEKPNKVRIKDIKYAWGSCSSNRNISINEKLAKKDKKIIEYVVLHEMCHLKYMNHSKEFWSLVATYMPEYKEYRRMLKQ